MDNVILNLNYYTVFGNYTGYGVHITSNNVTVQNGKITRFEKGVFIEGLKEDDSNSVLNNEFSDNNN